MRINRYVMPITVIAILALSVATASVMGLWKTAGRQDILEKVDRGAAKAEDIKGWMTLEEVSRWYNIPLEALYSGLNLHKSIKPSTQVKELEQTLPDFDTDVVRELVEKYQAGEKLQVARAPVEAKTPAEAKASPVDGKKTASVKEEKAPNASPAAAVTAEQKSAGESSELTAKSTLDDIRGRMTLKEIGDAFRISVSELISGLGLPAKVDINAPLKDYLEEYGLSITAIRDEVRAMLEK